MKITKQEMKKVAEVIAEELFDMVSDNYPDVAGNATSDMELDEEEVMDVQDQIENLAMMILVKKIGGKNVTIKKEKK